MEPSSLLIFCGAVLVGSYVQSVAGFAMGMMIVAAGGADGAIPLPVLMAVVSLVSALNIVFALRGRLGHIDRAIFFQMFSGQLPAIALGVWLFHVLDRDARTLLEILLGLFVTAGGVSLMLRRKSATRVSAPWACVVAGIAGGVLGGLFSASGPVAGWFLYKQPLALATVRATLLAFFFLSTMTRTVIVGIEGGLTAPVWALCGTAVPLVLLGTWLGHVAPPPVADATIRRAVTGLLVAMGLYIVVNAWP